MPHLRPLLALVAFVALTAAGSLAAPTCAYACSCIPPEDIADYRGQPHVVILAGTVATIEPDQRGTFAVERWFQGGTAAVVPIRGGQGADCGLPLSAGQRLIFVGYVEDGVIKAGICSPSGDLSTPEGQALARDAAAAFGGGVEPAGAPPSESDAPSIVLIAGGIAAVLVVASVVAFSRRERLEAPQP
jgi:hypothetical protein